MAALGSGLHTVIIAIAVTRFPLATRVIRSVVISAKEQPYVEAARALGAGRVRILGVHILPLAATPALTAAAFGIGNAVLFETALTFLGFGVPPPTASWGELLAQAQASGLRWWLLVPPTVAVAALVLACNLVGDGVRAALSAKTEAGGAA
jgi:peptide/nickel transport system permease protein